MHRAILTTLILVLIPISAISQTSNQQPAESNCKITEANAPVIRGIRLGMTTEQLLALFPGSSDKPAIKRALELAKEPNRYGVANLGFNPAEYSSRDQFSGIASIIVESYKDRVVSLRVSYIGPDFNGPNWRSIDQWIAKLSEAFGLPDAKDWASINNKTDRYDSKRLKCNEFEILAEILQGAGTITLYSPGYTQEIQESIKANEERKRREFKP